MDKSRLPNIIMLVGMPAAGKSSLAQHLERHGPKSSLVEKGTTFVRLNQDDLGKKELWKQFHAKLKLRQTVLILDNTNMRREDRREWISNALGVRIWCVFMDTPIETCKYRIERRKNHPTVREGQMGVRLLEQLEHDAGLEPPTKDEGYERIEVVRNEAELEYFLEHIVGLSGDEQVKIPVVDVEGTERIFKFPRTPHLINQSGKTKEDRVLTAAQLREFLGKPLVIHEKTDGANLGISLTLEGEVRVQNRSHWVCSTSDKQFAKLDKWKYRHQDELFALLEPGVEILYGEWMAHKHSIHYTSLPDWFLAFDIYNTQTDTWVSPDVLVARLQACTTIASVPVVKHGTFSRVEELSRLLSTPSRFYDGPLEGIYVRRIDADNKFTIDRCKLVRTDFITGNAHWSRMRTDNVLRPAVADK